MPSFDKLAAIGINRDTQDAKEVNGGHISRRELPL